jgi:hypothetical protein
MARTRRNVGQAASGEIQAVTIDNPGPPSPISMTATVVRDFGSGGETFEEAVARALPVVDPTVSQAAVDAVLLTTPIRRQRMTCERCHTSHFWTIRRPRSCRNCGRDFPPLATDEVIPVSETASKSRALTFERFNVRGTAENPIYVVLVEALRPQLPSGSWGERQQGWLDRLRECRGTFEGHTVYAFGREKLISFLKATKRIVVSRHGSNTQHVDWIRIGGRTRMPPELADLVKIEEFPPYQIEDFANRSSAYISLAGTVLGPIVKKKIVFVNEPIFSERGGFQIYIANNSHPGGRGSARHVQQIFGIADNNQYPSQICVYASENAHTGSAMFIRDEAQSINVAELHSNGLLILATLGENDFHSIRIFYRILQETIKFLVDPVEFERIKAEMALRFRESQKQHVVDCAKRAIAYMERNNGQDMRSATRRETTIRQIRDLENQLFELNGRLFAIDTTNVVQTTDRIAAEFESLMDGRMAQTQKVYFANNGDFHMITEPMVAFDRETRRHHLLGPCEMIVELPGKGSGRYHGSSGGGVRLFQHVGNGMQRRALPHCGTEGNVCFGNIGHEILALVAAFELQALVSLVITFLQRPNVFDRDGRRVREFPVCAAPTGFDAARLPE